MKKIKSEKIDDDDRYKNIKKSLDRLMTFSLCNHIESSISMPNEDIMDIELDKIQTDYKEF